MSNHERNPFRSHDVQQCTRCGGMLHSFTPRQIVAGHEGVFHLYCAWKLEKELKEQQNADPIRERRGSDPSLPSK